jgi:DNA-binding MarR family transcriptional regulator
MRLTSGNVLRRISRLVRLGLVERRHTERGPVTSEIRRIANI